MAKPIDISTSFGAITTLCNMSRQIPSLHSVAFVRSFVHGDELVRQAKTAKTVEGGALKFIKEIILDSTTGITQPQCVKLESYVSSIIFLILRSNRALNRVYMDLRGLIWVHLSLWALQSIRFKRALRFAFCHVNSVY